MSSVDRLHGIVPPVMTGEGTETPAAGQFGTAFESALAKQPALQAAPAEAALTAAPSGVAVSVESPSTRETLAGEVTDPASDGTVTAAPEDVDSLDEEGISPVIDGAGASVLPAIVIVPTPETAADITAINAEEPAAFEQPSSTLDIVQQSTSNGNALPVASTIEIPDPQPVAPVVEIAVTEQPPVEYSKISDTNTAIPAEQASTELASSQPKDGEEVQRTTSADQQNVTPRPEVDGEPVVSTAETRATQEQRQPQKNAPRFLRDSQPVQPSSEQPVPQQDKVVESLATATTAEVEAAPVQPQQLDPVPVQPALVNRPRGLRLGETERRPLQPTQQNLGPAPVTVSVSAETDADGDMQHPTSPDVKIRSGQTDAETSTLLPQPTGHPSQSERTVTAAVVTSSTPVFPLQSAVEGSDSAQTVSGISTLPAESFRPVGTVEISVDVAALPVETEQGEVLPALTPDAKNAHVEARSEPLAQTASVPVETSRHATTTLATGSVEQPEPVRYEQVLERVASALLSSEEVPRQLRIQLRPPELGMVQVEVAQRAGQLVARIETDQATTHRLLVEHLPELRESLAQQGLQLDRVDVQLGAHRGGQNFTQSGKQDQQEPGQRPAVPELARNERSDARRIATSTTVRENGRLAHLDVMI